MGPNRCNIVTYTTNLTAAQMNACTNPDGSKSISTTQTRSQITFSSTLYILLVGPYAISGTETSGYEEASWKYPFQVTYNGVVTSTSTTEGSTQATVTTTQIYIN